MSKRCKMAKEYNWPKRVVLQRFHDDFLRQFEGVSAPVSKICYYTELKRPSIICCNATFISSPMIARASKMKALAHVWAEPDGTCTMYIEDYRA